MSERKRFFAKIEGPSRTKQSMKDSCDINLIMGRYLRTGAVDHLAVHGGSYGFATSTSLQEAMNIVLKAESMFADLSSAVRKRFDNSPRLFLEFVQDPKNIDECRVLGLAAAKPPVAPVAPSSPGGPGAQPPATAIAVSAAVEAARAVRT